MKSVLAVVLVLCISSVSYAQFSLDEKMSIYRSYGYEGQKNYKMALNALKSTYQAKKQDYFLNMRLGYLFGLLGRSKNAISHYQRAQKANPSSIEPKLGIMNRYLADQKFNDAIKTAENILSKDPMHYYATLGLVNGWIGKRDWKTAQKFVDKMLNRSPSDAIFLGKKAYIEDKLGHKKESQNTYELIQTLYPTSLPEGILE